MPTMAEGLTPQSSDAQVTAAISDCVAQQLREHPDMKQDQAVAICYSQARTATGKGLAPKGGAG